MKNSWERLDNAAKIFPSSGKKSDTQVFRFSCELFENVNPAILQKALNETIKVFPVYQCILKRGIFWYYLESTDIKPIVQEEHNPPCARIYYKDKKALLFEVTYFKKRINLEVYHVLSDGTGAMHFLKMLLTKYLSMIYHLKEPTLDYDASHTQMKDDSFSKYYSPAKSTEKKKFKIACQIKGAKFSEGRLKVLTGVVSVQSMLSVARKYNTTLTIFICACLINAISEEMPIRRKKKPIVLGVPVNLRKYFPSESARNFFSLIFVEYNYSKNSGEFEDVLSKLSSDFKEKLTVDHLKSNINTFSAVEHNVFAKIAPLSFKDMCLKYAYDISMLARTATVSNVGAINMSEELQQYIRQFDVYTGTDKLQICICSFKDKLSISFTTPLISSDIPRRFFRQLTGLGLEVEILSNIVEDE